MAPIFADRAAGGLARRGRLVYVRVSPHVPHLQPSFLICSERSGSNLIRSILNAHPEIYAPDPIHLAAFWERVGEFGDLSDDRRWRTLLTAIVEFLQSWKGTLYPGLAFDIEELEAAAPDRDFVAIYEHVYTRGLAASGKPRLFIKENHTAQRAGPLIAAYPRAKFVYQVRDPRDYLASCKQMPAYKYGSASAALAVWCADQRAATELIERLPPTQVFSGRYEDLIRAPEAYLGQLCAFLGLAYAPQMLEFYKTEDAQRASLHSAWRNLGRPIIQSNSGRYGEWLTSEEIELVERQAGDLMIARGYMFGAGDRKAPIPQVDPPTGDRPHLMQLDDDSGSAAVQRIIQRHVDALG